MSKAIRFIFFVDDPERASQFYSQVLGWKIEKSPMFEGQWSITAGSQEEDGIDGNMEKRVGNRSTVNNFLVASLSDTLAKVTRAGGKILEEKELSMGYHAFCEDTEGNVFGIFQAKPPPAR
jgi:predicted enzyme related to lactoylglutathione lyase